MNLCELCLENKLPFKAKRTHWKNAYVVVTHFSNDSNKNGYFKVYGKVYGPLTKYNYGKTSDGSIKNSGVYGWELL